MSKGWSEKQFAVGTPQRASELCDVDAPAEQRPFTPQKIVVDGMPVMSISIKDGKTIYSALMKTNTGDYVDLIMTEAQYNVMKRY